MIKASAPDLTQPQALDEGLAKALSDSAEPVWTACTHWPEAVSPRTLDHGSAHAEAKRSAVHQRRQRIPWKALAFVHPIAGMVTKARPSPTQPRTPGSDGKPRPLDVFSAPACLAADPPVWFVCPLSSRSDPTIRTTSSPALPERDQLKRPHNARVEHCRAITERYVYAHRRAMLTHNDSGKSCEGLGRLDGP